MLVFDTSGSMLATDVEPVAAAPPRSWRARRSSDKVPDGFRIGVISFGSSRPAARASRRPTTRA